MIRKAIKDDINVVATLYDKMIDYEDSHVKYTSWRKGIYPTSDTAKLGVKNDSLFVMEENGEIIAAVILDTKQPPEYRDLPWKVDAGHQKALVIHTLCVDPEHSGEGLGSALVEYAKSLALDKKCLCVRLNTTSKNSPALHMYEKNGFYTVAERKILLNGQIPCGEHLFMEYKL